MDIQVISNSCAKIILTKDEGNKLNINFEHFNKENPETKAFLTYIISILNDLDIIKSKKDKISVEVYEQENEDLIIYISAYPEIDEIKKTNYEFSYVTDSPDQLIDFSKTAALFLPQKVNDLYLYYYKETYYLIFESNLSKTSLIKIFSSNNIYHANSIEIAKAKEYGIILSHTPFKIISNLSSY